MSASNHPVLTFAQILQIEVSENGGDQQISFLPTSNKSQCEYLVINSDDYVELAMYLGENTIVMLRRMCNEQTGYFHQTYPQDQNIITLFVHNWLLAFKNGDIHARASLVLHDEIITVYTERRNSGVKIHRKKSHWNQASKLQTVVDMMQDNINKRTYNIYLPENEESCFGLSRENVPAIKQTNFPRISLCASC